MHQLYCIDSFLIFYGIIGISLTSLSSGKLTLALIIQTTQTTIVFELIMLTTKWWNFNVELSQMFEQISLHEIVALSVW
jgi:hypothetical protein